MNNRYERNIIDLIKKHLTPDLLSKEYEFDENNPLAGHCYISAECSYHIFAKTLHYKPHHIKWQGKSHWFLQLYPEHIQPYQKSWIKKGYEIIDGMNDRNKKTYLDNPFDPQIGILDLTYTQFSTIPKYSKSIGKGFLTKNPSKRTQILMDRVLEDIV